MAQPKLLEQYRERLRVKHYSLRTEQACLHWVRRFISGYTFPMANISCARSSTTAPSHRPW